LKIYAYGACMRSLLDRYQRLMMYSLLTYVLPSDMVFSINSYYYFNETNY